MRMLIVLGDKCLQILTPIFVPIRLAISAIGIILIVTSPSANFEANAKKAWIKTSIVVVGSSSLQFFVVKKFKVVEKKTAPPIPMAELKTPITQKIG